MILWGYDENQIEIKERLPNSINNHKLIITAD